MFTQEEARSLLEEILNRREFAVSGPEAIFRFLNRAAASLLGFLYSQGLWVLVLISILATATLLGLALWFFFRHRPSLEKEGGLPEEDGGRESPRSALSRSADAASRSSFKEAIRYLLLSLLLQLDREGAIRYHFARTNGEYLRELSQKGFPAYPPVADLVFLYEKIWYGRSGCRREDYEQGLKLFACIQEAGR